jgi:DNA-binding response OmpR family regulator
MIGTQVRLLAIDTDRDAVRTLAAQLHPHGVATGAVADPNEAAAGVLRFSPNVVLVAAELGGRSGAEIVAQLARDPRTLHLPVVLVTAQPRGDELLLALRAGAADYFLTPLREEVEIPALLELARQHPSPGAPFASSFSERLLRVMARLQLSAELTSQSEPHCSARFENGQLTQAQCDALRGEGALDALFALPDLALRAAPASPPAPDPMLPDTLDLLEVEIAEEPGASPGLRLRCLLVDDEPDLLRLFSAFLKRAGFEVLTAPDGAQGYELCLAERPDVVVADLNMPHLDGWGLLRKLRSDVRVAETPVVFLSAQDDYRESLRAVNAGAQDYLAKASKMDLLAKRVRVALEPRDQARAAVLAFQGVHGRIEQLGVRWLLGELARAKRTGTVAFADSLGVYNVGIKDGAAVFAGAQQSQKRVAGEAALSWVVRLRDGDAQFLPDQLPPAENLSGGSLIELLERLAATASAADEQAMEALLVRAAGIEVDGNVFSLYERFCPPFGREVARFIRAGKTPKQILAESNLNPLEVVETLRDMVRRQVVRLRG